MVCIDSVKNYVIQAETKPAGYTFNTCEEIGNALISPMRWAITQYDAATSGFAKAAYMAAGVFALALFAIGAIFKKIGESCHSSSDKASLLNGKADTQEEISDSSSKALVVAAGSGAISLQGTGTTTLSRVDRAIAIVDAKKREETIRNGIETYGPGGKSLEELAESGINIRSLYTIAQASVGLVRQLQTIQTIIPNLETAMAAFEQNASAQEKANIKEFERRMGAFMAFIEPLMSQLDSGGSPLESAVSIWIAQKTIYAALGAVIRLTERDQNASKLCQQFQKKVDSLMNNTWRVLEAIAPGILVTTEYVGGRLMGALAGQQGYELPTNAQQHGSVIIEDITDAEDLIAQMRRNPTVQKALTMGSSQHQ